MSEDSPASPPPTQALVALSQAGDEGARTALYERYYQRVLSIVRARMGKLLRTRMESKDLVQSVLLESLQDLGAFEFRTEGAFVHWLSTLAERKIRDKVSFHTAQKRDARRQEAPEEGMDEPLALVTGGTTPSRLLSKAEELLRMEEALQALPENERELVVMAKLEGLSYEEIAQATGRTAGSAQRAVSRALAKLTTALYD